LAHIENPYIEINGATTYEILSCYNGLRTWTFLLLTKIFLL
jgi:hypothetical protein